MKTYEQVAARVLERRDAYAAAQAKTRKIVGRGVAVGSGVCLAAVLGVVLWRGNHPATPPATAGDSVVIGEPCWVDDRPTTQPTPDTTSTPPDTAPDSIVINPMDGISSDRIQSNICLIWDDFVEMNREELTAYFGTAVFPAVPADLAAWDDNQRCGIYRREGGTGEVYWDGQVLNWSNADFSRSVNVEVSKGGLPATDIGNFYDLSDKSIIHGVEVAIGHSDAGYYFAEFVYRDVGFRIITEGLSQDETVAVIASLVA